MRHSNKTELGRDDLLPLDVYARDRRALRREIMAIKRRRRIHVGPIATFYFENYQTMWHQVHEMLLIEKGGEAQVDDELRAYNPLVPKGRELVATVMLEIEDPALRARPSAISPHGDPAGGNPRSARRGFRLKYDPLVLHRRFYPSLFERLRARSDKHALMASVSNHEGAPNNCTKADRSLDQGAGYFIVSPG